MKPIKLILLMTITALVFSSCGRKNHAQELESQIKSMGGASA